MTNEIAIHRLLLVRHRKDCTELLAEALDMAIEALSNNKKQTDSLIRTSTNSASATDVIYRKQAIDAVKRLSLGETDALRLTLRIEDYLERLPSAQPEHPLLKIIQDFKEATGCKEILVVQKDAMKAWDENGVEYTMQPKQQGDDMRGEEHDTERKRNLHEDPRIP